ncbi:MAG: hypothetical protein KatS3mg092_0377 [Patescibacteria group bacterium]|nr:MAG: hypothetical protein KatS3mg092_0377 [Patescibacteria group bacterium]
MDNFNKIISFILGLVVIIIFFAVVSGRLNLGKFTPSFAKKTNISPTPTSISKVVISENEIKTNNVISKNETKTNNYQNNSYSINAKSIPATGLPTFFIPSILSSALFGVFLKKYGKK